MKLIDKEYFKNISGGNESSEAEKSIRAIAVEVCGGEDNVKSSDDKGFVCK